MCNRCVQNDGACETYFEKHRGDETPFARVLAKECGEQVPIDVANKFSASQPADDAIVFPEHQLSAESVHADIGKRASNVTASLKLYQCDLEVAALFVLPSSELLVSFKLLQPLAQVDRDTGRNYANLHDKQSFFT